MRLDGFPKRANLRDGSQVLLRPVGFEDAEGLLLLYRSLPEEDRLVLRDDVSRTEWSERFLTKVALGDVLSIVAAEDGRLVAEAETTYTLEDGRVLSHAHHAEAAHA